MTKQEKDGMILTLVIWAVMTAIMVGSYFR